MSINPDDIINKESIDEDHRLLKTMLESSEKATSKAQLLSILIDIYRHAVVHFLEEEQFMLEQAMPVSYIDSHCDIHETLRKKIQNTIASVDSLEMEDLKAAVAKYKDTMLAHIDEVDSKMEDHLPNA